jgi:hypothetical protein
MRRLAQSALKFLNQPRLAEPRLANDQYQLPIALACSLPAPHQYGDLFVATDEWREMATPSTAAVTQGAADERRQVTVLFCDLVDSTGIVAKLDR